MKDGWQRGFFIEILFFVVSQPIPACISSIATSARRQEDSARTLLTNGGAGGFFFVGNNVQIRNSVCCGRNIGSIIELYWNEEGCKTKTE